MRKILRFLLSQENQQRIEPSTIFFQQGEVGFPDSLRMGFNLKGPIPSPSALPFIPFTSGTLYFLPDVLSGGVPPQLPTDGSEVETWIDSGYPNWTTRGTIVIDVRGKEIKDIVTSLGYTSLLNDAHNFFNRQWYWPLNIPADFLQQTLLNLNPAKVQKRDGSEIPTTHELWHFHAVYMFLRGGYGLRFTTDASDPTKDDAVLHSFPEFLIDSTANYTEVWMALALAQKSVHDGNVNLMREIADDMSVLDPLRPLAAANADLLSLHPLHPENGSLSTTRTLQHIRDHLEDADPGLPLADEFFNNQVPYHTLRFTLPGNSNEIYYLGALPTQKIRIRDEGGNLLQERRIPLHGYIFLRKTSSMSSLVLELTEGDLRATALDGATIPDTPTLNIPLNGGNTTSHITLQPRWSTISAAEKTRSAHRISDICYNLSNQKTTKKLVSNLYKLWENKIRPGSRPTGERVFRGSRKPWKKIDNDDLTSLFNGLHNLSFTGATALPLRPAEAMALWIMEGKILTVDRNLFTSEIPVPEDIGNFTRSQIRGASEDEIQTLVRVIICWRFWGLDIMNHHGGADDNLPFLSGNFTDAMASHDNHFTSRGLEAIQTEGIVPPTVNQVNQTINIEKRGRRWLFQAAPNHKEVMIWLQYSEYLRRQSRLKKVAVEMGLPETMALSPAFSYMAYNGGLDQDLVANGWDPAVNTWKMFTMPTPPSPWKQRLIWKWWDRVKTEIETNPDDWKDKSMEDVLTNWKITNFANEKDKTYTHLNKRSEAVRVNGLHFAAIVRTYGSVFPTIL